MFSEDGKYANVNENWVFVEYLIDETNNNKLYWIPENTEFFDNIITERDDGYMKIRLFSAKIKNKKIFIYKLIDVIYEEVNFVIEFFGRKRKKVKLEIDDIKIKILDNNDTIILDIDKYNTSIDLLDRLYCCVDSTVGNRSIHEILGVSVIEELMKE